MWWLMSLFAICSNILLLVTFAQSRAIIDELNSSPIIAILAQETNEQYGPGSSYINADYVKFLESSGARVVPICSSASEELLKEIFSKVNGLLLPGGDESSNRTGYRNLAKVFFKLAMRANDNGKYFPIWGTGLGFQIMAEIVAGDANIISESETWGVAYPLNFTESIDGSRMFSEMSSLLKKQLSSEKLTINAHRGCVTRRTFQQNMNLRNFFRVLSTNTDFNGQQFASTVEAIKYPFYGVQWHPEMNSFNFVGMKPEGLENIPHSADAVRVTQFFGNFFVDESRKSAHRFSSWWDEEAVMIYQRTPVHTGIMQRIAEQTYYFN